MFDKIPRVKTEKIEYVTSKQNDGKPGLLFLRITPPHRPFYKITFEADTLGSIILPLATADQSEDGYLTETSQSQLTVLHCISDPNRSRHSFLGSWS